MATTEEMLEEKKPTKWFKLKQLIKRLKIKYKQKDTSCTHEKAYHFHDNAPAYCSKCNSYPEMSVN